MAFTRFFSPFYLLTPVLLLSLLPFLYLPLRSSSPTSLSRLTGFTGWGEAYGVTQEIELCGVILFSFFSKYRRLPSLDAAIQKLFFHLQLLLLLLVWFASKSKALAILLPLYLVHYLVLRPPPFRGASSLTSLPPDLFETRVRSAPKESADRRAAWVVAFWADWCPGCQVLEAMVAGLSVRYGGAGGGGKRMFGKVDVVRFPEMAERFRIDTR